MATATASKINQELRDKLKVEPPDQTVKWLNLFVYGDSGVGKTYLGGTSEDDPRTSPILWLDSEGGVTTIKKRKSIDVVKVRGLADVERVGTELAKAANEGTMHYKMVVIDSLTELADLDMREVMKEAYNRNPDKVDKDVPSPREYGKVRNHIRIITRHFKDLPCHVYFTGHVGSVTDEATNVTKFFPAFSGKLAREIPGFVDIVGYYSQKVSGEEVVRTLQTQGTHKVVAKDRTQALQPLEVNPTIPGLWDIIEAAQKS